ncbi:MAG TPA: peptidylprolyl isomerase [Ramlibacter sp.]|nr:peptidylprolyl isomerase [Ramlibacter sp.]
MTTASSGCGGGSCGCAGQETSRDPAASINGVALHAPGEQLDEGALRELAWGELLRQEAVRQGLLPRRDGANAPALSERDQQVIEAMLERTIPVAAPADEECRRYYESRQAHFMQGARVRARHILFAVTPGVDVGKLAARAEQALLELSHKDVGPGRFSELAGQLSNCPSGTAGGDLGWIGPQDCADELARDLFHQSPLPGVGLRPRLVHSRYGFHILEVLEREEGRLPAFDEVRQRIAVQLAQQSRAKALHQYMQLLAGRAEIAGIELAEAGSPLVQ